MLKFLLPLLLRTQTEKHAENLRVFESGKRYKYCRVNLFVFLPSIPNEMTFVAVRISDYLANSLKVKLPILAMSLDLNEAAMSGNVEEVRIRLQKVLSQDRVNPIGMLRCSQTGGQASAFYN